MSKTVSHWRGCWMDTVLLVMALAWVLVLHGAVPGLLLPTLGQAVWTTTFSQSFANAGFFAVHSTDIGLPDRQVIAFGLAGAWPAGVLIRCGLNPSDAYSGVVAFWLLVSFTACHAIARRLGASRRLALLAAVLWLSMPVVWGHTGYGLVGVGIALLPFYFCASLWLFMSEAPHSLPPPRWMFCYLGAALVAVFMDGYSFVMWVTGSSYLLLYSAVRHRHDVRVLAARALLHVVSLCVAYFLYILYLGKPGFEAHPLDFFRGWGLDLTFALSPTKGVHALPDTLGLSVARSNHTYYGDASVWSTTYALPMAILASLAIGLGALKSRVGVAAILLAVLGFYMALGPTLKVDARKPEAAVSAPHSPLVDNMPAQAGSLATGSAWISGYLPGFKVMRASYRWVALGMFGLWLLVVSRLSADWRAAVALACGGLLVVVFQAPDMRDWWRVALTQRQVFVGMDREVGADFARAVQPGEVVVFVPWGNDFIYPFFASRAGFRTYNVGGDKNLREAQKAWPADLIQFPPQPGPEQTLRMLKLALEGGVDAFVVPELHNRWPSDLFPCLDSMEQAPQPQWLGRVTGFTCPDAWTGKREALLEDVRRSPLLDVKDFPSFSTVRLRAPFAQGKNLGLATLLREVTFPIVLGTGGVSSPIVLTRGWYGAEKAHVWSGTHASLRIPVPQGCEHCWAELEFVALAPASGQSVRIDLEASCSDWRETMEVAPEVVLRVKVPLSGCTAVQRIDIAVPGARSPFALGRSADRRVLGIALRRVGLVAR